MKKKIIFSDSNEKSNCLTVSPNDFIAGIHNFEYIDYSKNYKKCLEKSVFQGISFLEHFNFNGISIWWLIHERFYYAIQPNINFILLFEFFLKKHQPQIIEIKNHFEYFKLIEQICKKNNVKLEYNKYTLKKYNLKQHSKKFIRNIIRPYRLSKLTKKRIKDHLFQFKNKYNVSQSIDQKIIFVSPETYRKSIFNSQTETFERGEYLTNSLIQLFDEPRDHLGLSVPNTSSTSFMKIFEERLNDSMVWIPEELFLKNDSTRISEFLKKYNSLIQMKDFQKLFSFHDINFWDSISGMFTQMTFPPYLPYLLSLYLGYCDKFQYEKPKSVFMPSEIDPQNQILIFACKKFNINTVGLQQGFFSYSGPPGFFHDSELHLHKFGYPFPSKYFVWGEPSKKILIELGWPESSLEIFGHTYYRDLKKINQLLESPPYSKFNLNSSKKIILFTTTEFQSMYSYSGYVYDSDVWKYLLKNFLNNDEFIIILKPHPHENISEYEQILKESFSKNAFIIQDNLHELISISDVIVSNHSTVILDALSMKKPTLELEWFNINENFSQYTPLVESVKIENLKDKIYSIIKNYDYDEKLWLQTMNYFFNISFDKSHLKLLLNNISSN
tara:strand:+ start:1928 stop:3766 length:1839 start_codon:yes stop_codon:yes gene_type:complete